MKFSSFEGQNLANSQVVPKFKLKLLRAMLVQCCLMLFADHSNEQMIPQHPARGNLIWRRHLTAWSRKSC